jgi:hypothetical protein
MKHIAIFPNATQAPLAIAAMIVDLRRVRRSRGSVCLAGMVLCMAVVPQFSKAGTVYSSFGPGQSYFCCAEQTVSGATATAGGTLLGQNEVAGAFTPAANFDLTQIDVAFDGSFTPPGTNGFNLSLNGDSGGVPGVTIEAWTGLTGATNLMGGNTYSVVESVFPAGGTSVLLLTGQQYWIVASPADSNTFIGWVRNSGTGGIYATNSGDGWHVNSTISSALAFDVQGSPVPEPRTLSLLVVGLLGMGYAAKRKLSCRA